jgi:hypothetical protein
MESVQEPGAHLLDRRGSAGCGVGGVARRPRRSGTEGASPDQGHSAPSSAMWGRWRIRRSMDYGLMIQENTEGQIRKRQPRSVRDECCGRRKNVPSDDGTRSHFLSSRDS